LLADEAFHQGQFWHSHEHWEACWKVAPRGCFKIMIQALIQTAACAVLLEQGRMKGFCRKRVQTLSKLSGFMALDYTHCAGYSLVGLIQFHDKMAALAMEQPQPNASLNSEIVQAWEQEVLMRHG
jgi:hypothetical protein